MYKRRVERFNIPVYDGTYAIKAVYSAAYGGIYLQNDGIDVSGADTLRFAIHGGATGGQEPELKLYDEDDAWIGNVLINDYISGGTIAADTWYEIAIPLSDFGTPTDIGGIVIMNSTNDTLYIDDIRFTGGAGGTAYGYDENDQRVLVDDGAVTAYPNKYYTAQAGTTTRSIFAPDGALLATVE